MTAASCPAHRSPGTTEAGRFAARRAATAVLAGAIASSACTVGPDYLAPNPEMPASFTESTADPVAGVSDAALAQWWTTFGDPVLDRLIDEALRGNLDLREADARISEARALLRISGAQGVPQVNADGGYTYARTSNEVAAGPVFGGREAGRYDAGFDASWELDVFGHVRRSVEAAGSDLGAREEDRRAAQVALAGEVARSYLDLRSAQERLDIARRNVETQTASLEISQARFASGLSSELDVAQAGAQRASTMARIPPLEVQVQTAMHRLAVLRGDPPAKGLPELVAVARIPEGPDSVPPGLPSDLLRRRPDIRGAERELAAETARVGVAVAELYPRFTINGSMGVSAEQFSGLGNGDAFRFGLGPSVTWPLFEGGRIRGRIEAQEARVEQAMARYERTMLTALSDVEDAIVTHGRERERRDSLETSVDASRRAAEIAQELYSKGLRDFTDVVISESALFNAEDALAVSRHDIAVGLVAVYKSLGGGW